MSEIKNTSENAIQPKSTKKSEAKLAEKSFGCKVRDAFISEEIHDIKSYAIFDVLIPAVKKTVRNLIVNVVDIGLFGKTTGSGGQGNNGGSTYISYDRAYERAYGGPEVSYPKHAQRQQGQMTIGVRELDRVRFRSRDKASEALMYLFDKVEEDGCASVADFLSVAEFPISPIHHKWGWYYFDDASIEEIPGESDYPYYVRLPKPKSI